MTLKELRDINNILSELWDFFGTNSDGDETGLNEELSVKYGKAQKAISDEFYKIHLRNEKQKVLRKFKK
jgi:hypothetical protein